MAQYLKPDCDLGYIEDTAEIEFLKFNNLRHTVLGCMLGDYDELGAYVVSPEIVKELIVMEKYIFQTYDNIELCKSTLKLDKQISFIVAFEGNKATLSLIEKLNYEGNFSLNSGTYSNVNEYVLDSVETSGEVNRNMIYARWNIKTTQPVIIDIFNCEDSILEKYFGIVNRFKYLLRSNKILLKNEQELEEFEAKYANEVLRVLKHNPKLKKAVIQEIKTNLEEKKESISVNKPFFVKSFNELLENAIQKNLADVTEEEKKEFTSEKRNAIVELNINRQNVLEVEPIEQQQKHDEQLTPRIYQIKYPFEEKKKTLTETAQEFIEENKIVEQRVTNSKKEKSKSYLLRRTILAIGEEKGNSVELPEESLKADKYEKSKLVEKLTEAGLNDLIGVERKVEEVETPETKVEQVKPPEVKKSPAKSNNSNGKVTPIKHQNFSYEPKKGNERGVPRSTDGKQGKARTEKTDEQGSNNTTRLFSGSSGRHVNSGQESAEATERQTEVNAGALGNDTVINNQVADVREEVVIIYTNEELSAKYNETVGNQQDAQVGEATGGEAQVNATNSEAKLLEDNLNVQITTGNLERDSTGHVNQLEVEINEDINVD